MLIISYDRFIHHRPRPLTHPALHLKRMEENGEHLPLTSTLAGTPYATKLLYYAEDEQRATAMLAITTGTSRMD